MTRIQYDYTVSARFFDPPKRQPERIEHFGGGERDHWLQSNGAAYSSGLVVDMALSIVNNTPVIWLRKVRLECQT